MQISVKLEEEKGEICVGKIVQKVCLECYKEGIKPGSTREFVSHELKSVMAVADVKEFHADHHSICFLSRVCRQHCLCKKNSKFHNYFFFTLVALINFRENYSCES